MHKDRPQRGAREHIAQLAARLMAEDHVSDFAMAKRKAARQLGLPEGKNLPTNQEVETALRQYRDLYQPEHGSVINGLRRQALQVMARFAGFRPYLTGSALSGLAGPHSDINLIVYSDDPKSVELFCLNAQIDYRLESRPGEEADYPTLAFYADNNLVRLSVRPESNERATARGYDHPLDRARIEQVQQLLDHASPASLAA